MKYEPHKLKRATLWKAVRARVTTIWTARRRPWLMLWGLNRSPRGLAGQADVVSMCELLDVAEHRGYRLVVCCIQHGGGRCWAVCFGVPKASVQ